MFRSSGLIAASILVVGTPIFGGLYLAHRETRDAEMQQVALLAHALIGRAQTIAQQSQAAVRLLQQHGDGAPCSPARIALMRRIDLGSSYLQAVGFAADNRLLCSSLGDHGEGIPLGPVRFTSPFGDGIRPSVHLPMLSGQQLLVAEHGGSVTFVHPGLILDVASGPGVWAGIVNLSQRMPMVERGGFSDAWLDHAPPAGQDAYFTDGDRAVALYRPPGHDFVAYASTPLSAFAGRGRALFWQLGLVGAAVGGALWLLLRLQVRHLRSLATVLKAAIRSNEICMEYQPIVDLATDRWVGVEALVRWRRPDGSFVRPEVFIRVAEDNGLIRALTERVIGIVAEEAPALLEQHPDFYIAINLSAADLATWKTPEQLRLLTQRPGISARNICIEATEHSLLNAESTRDVLRAIRELGVRAAIDDFGTGYSGLSYLGKFEVDTLKIDKAFVDTIGTDAVTSNVALHIIELARTLRLQIVAEGIENEEQAAFLREHGVRYGQGWLFARSMPMNELMAALASSGDAALASKDEAA